MFWALPSYKRCDFFLARKTLLKEFFCTFQSGIAGALANVTLGEQRTPEQEALESQMRRQCWESGNIDYMGRDSFENILKRINLTMGETPETQKEDVVPETKEGNE